MEYLQTITTDGLWLAVRDLLVWRLKFYKEQVEMADKKGDKKAKNLYVKEIDKLRHDLHLVGITPVSETLSLVERSIQKAN